MARKGISATDEFLKSAEFAYPPPAAAQRFVTKHKSLPPKWLEQEMRSVYGRGSTPYWGEQAIEAMEVLMGRSAIPTAREKATTEALRRILE